MPGPMMSAGPGHHQVPMTQAQVAQQQQQAAMQVEMAKRRSKKPTDKNLPDGIDDCTLGDVSKRYRELRDFERRLDATMTRKRLDIVDSVNRSVKVRPYCSLRYFPRPCADLSCCFSATRLSVSGSQTLSRTKSGSQTASTTIPSTLAQTPSRLIESRCKVACWKTTMTWTRTTKLAMKRRVTR